MLQFIDSLDLKIARWLSEKVKNPILDSFLSRVNRGELFVVFILYLLYDTGDLFIRSVIFLSILAFINDRTVLVLKKRISRERPSIQVLGKENNHPDLSHSFPSAHAANSMVAVILLVFLFHQSPYLFVIPVLAGLGRMITLHHFLSDVLGGWLIGLFFGVFGFFSYQFLLLNSMF